MAFFRKSNIENKIGNIQPPQVTPPQFIAPPPISMPDPEPLMAPPPPVHEHFPEEDLDNPPGVGSELFRLGWLAVAIVHLLALVSYHAEDPSFSTWSSDNSVHNYLGHFGSWLADLSLQFLGYASYLATATFVFLGLWSDPRTSKVRHVFGRVACLIALICGTLCIETASRAFIPKTRAGGLTGEWLGSVLYPFVGKTGTFVLSSFIFVACLTFVTRIPFLSMLKNALKRLVMLTWDLSITGVAYLYCLVKKSPLPEKHIEPELSYDEINPEDSEEEWECSEDENESEEDWDEETTESDVDNYDSPKPKKRTLFKKPKKRRGRFVLPSVKLINAKLAAKKAIDKNWYLERGEILVQKLNDFGVEGEIVNIAPGPVITVYEFKPASGVKIREIANLSDDLTLALSALSVRIVAPIPGKPVVGIEIPSPHRETVHFKELVQEKEFTKGEQDIPVILGSTASGGQTFVTDLAAMPHLLIAGATGTGKSVFINTLITSLLYRFNPEELKLILVDPKMVELSQFDRIPHLLLPVVVDSKKAAMALRWLIDEMERRYTLMHQLGVRHVDSFNERLKEMRAEGDGEDLELLPYIVTVIDEYADLMAVVPKEVELSITRLAQKARASGIHLVLATQRPSTDVVTGTIKANFPCRISFRVSSSVDSKTILDRTGAERLLGNGDLLFLSPGFNALKRLQGPFLADKDITRIVNHLRSQGEPEYDEAILNPPEGDDRNIDLLDGDDKEARLYDQAIRIVSEKGEASISLIQRHLKIGYNRAATLMEQLEKDGIVGGASGPSKRRPVLIQSH